MIAVEIARIGAGGDGVGRLPEGIVVFVPRTAPGDEVEIEVTERRARYARGRLVRVLRAGAGRAEPACPHYSGERCGGCQLQHLAPAVQLLAKRAIVGDALRRIGHRELPDPEIEPAPAAWRYRTKVTLAADGGRIGLHPYDAPMSVFSLADCHITREPLMRLWDAARRWPALLPQTVESITLREDREGGLHFIVSGGGEPAAPWDPQPLAAALGVEQVSFWWRPPGGAVRVVAGKETGFPPLAFEQVNPALGARIREDAVDALGDVGDKTVWDLYGGVGDTAELLAARGARVISVDADQRAIEWARRRVEPGKSITFLAGLVEESLHRLPRPDAVIANPPRAGLAVRVTAALAEWGAAQPRGRLCYVSCDPATLARDLTRLPAFAPTQVRAYDLFPQTSHVETLVVLERA